MSLAFTFVDAAVVAIVVISMIFAIWRGFISETLSIFAWAAAAFATLYFGPFVAPIVSHLFSPSWLAWLVGYAGVFLFVLIPISYGSFRLSESVQPVRRSPQAQPALPEPLDLTCPPERQVARARQEQQDPPEERALTAVH